MKLLQICYKVRRNIVEGAYKTCRSQNITWHLLAVRAEQCWNLITNTLRARYTINLLDIWAGTCIVICSQVLHILLLAPANSSHLRSLWSVAVHGGADNWTHHVPAQPALAHSCTWSWSRTVTRSLRDRFTSTKVTGVIVIFTLELLSKIADSRILSTPPSKKDYR